MVSCHHDCGPPVQIYRGWRAEATSTIARGKVPTLLPGRSVNRLEIAVVTSEVYRAIPPNDRQRVNNVAIRHYPTLLAHGSPPNDSRTDNAGRNRLVAIFQIGGRGAYLLQCRASMNAPRATRSDMANITKDGSNTKLTVTRPAHRARPDRCRIDAIHRASTRIAPAAFRCRYSCLSRRYSLHPAFRSPRRNGHLR